MSKIVSDEDLKILREIFDDEQLGLVKVLDMESEHVKTLQAALADATSMLRDCEWYSPIGIYCQFCNNHDIDGHTDECRLNNFLMAWEEPWGGEPSLQAKVTQDKLND